MILLKDLDKLKNDSTDFKIWIEEIQKLNDKLEEYLFDKRKKWNDAITPLLQQLKTKSQDEIIELQALALSYRQQLSDEISTFLNKLSKEMIAIKKAEADRFIFYSTGFGIKTNTGEKKILFDSELAELERNREILETHIEFIRDCRVTCDNISWALKNKIALMGILDNAG